MSSVDCDSWPWKAHKNAGSRDAQRGRKNFDLYDPHGTENQRAYTKAFNVEIQRKAEEELEEQERQYELEHQENCRRRAREQREQEQRERLQQEESSEHIPE